MSQAPGAYGLAAATQDAGRHAAPQRPAQTKRQSQLSSQSTKNGAAGLKAVIVYSAADGLMPATLATWLINRLGLLHA